ncbi:MAG: hypothetical protein ACK4WF_00375 [Candidatus Brocadiales bacterium]
MIDVGIYLPVYYNDGTKVEDEKFTQTFEELAERFGGGTIFEGIKGVWYSGGRKYADEIKIVEITVPETPEIKE